MNLKKMNQKQVLEKAKEKIKKTKKTKVMRPAKKKARQRKIRNDKLSFRDSSYINLLFKFMK